MEEEEVNTMEHFVGTKFNKEEVISGYVKDIKEKLSNIEGYQGESEDLIQITLEDKSEGELKVLPLNLFTHLLLNGHYVPANILEGKEEFTIADKGTFLCKDGTWGIMN